MMNRRVINPNDQVEDWFGNNIAITCPVCGKVYVVSGFLKGEGVQKGERKCPKCGKSMGKVESTAGKPSTATVIWEQE